MHNHELKPYDYYHGPHDGCAPCPHPGLHAYPGRDWELALHQHNIDEKAHPYLLKRLKSMVCNYCYKDSLSARDLIPAEERKVGMMVYVAETDLVYRLERGVENSHWNELNINSKQYIKLGRYNPPEKPTLGTTYFDLKENRIKVFLGEWISLPNMLDINRMIQDHNVDPKAHADRFAQVENIWLAI